jgi:hypothetical protein
MRKFFNAAVHNYDISFWDTDLCLEISRDPDLDLLPEYRYGDDYDYDDLEDLEDDKDEDEDTEQPDADEPETPDDREPAWSVEIKYQNGTEQNTRGYDYIPDPVMELFDDIDGYFFEEDDEDFDGDGLSGDGIDNDDNGLGEKENE